MKITENALSEAGFPEDQKLSELHLHFVGNLPTQQQALLAWAEHLLFVAEGKLTQADLHQRLCGDKYIPYAIQVEEQELSEALLLGVKKNQFEEDDGKTYTLSPGRRYALEQAQTAARTTGDSVKASWAAELSEDYDLTDVLIDELWSGLSRFAVVVMRRYKSRVETLSTGSGQNLVRKVFPKGHPLSYIAEVEYPKFFLSEDTAKQAILGRYLSHVLYAFRTSVSDAAAQELRNSTKGLGLYLDTNVLLPALGLSGDSTYEAGVKGILKLAQQAGMKLLFTARTQQEYEAAMNRFRQRFERGRNSDVVPEYVSRRQRPSIERAFYNFRSRDFLTSEEFYERYSDLSNVTREQNELGIEKEHLITNEQDEAILASAVFGESVDALRAVERSNYSTEVLEHDAYHLALIAYLRDGSQRYKNTKAWYLTLDNSLPKVNRKLGYELPLVMTLDAWILTFRQFLPRVDDFEQFLTSIVSRSLFPSFYISSEDVHRFREVAQSDSDRRANEVIGRLIRTRAADEITQVFDREDNQDVVRALHALVERDDRNNKKLIEYGTTQLEKELQARDEALEKEHKKLEEAEREIKTHKATKSELARLTIELDNLRHQKYKLEHRLDRATQRVHGCSDELEGLSQKANMRAAVISAPLVVFTVLILWGVWADLPQNLRSLLPNGFRQVGAGGTVSGVVFAIVRFFVQHGFIEPNRVRLREVLREAGKDERDAQRELEEIDASIKTTQNKLSMA